MQMTIKEYNETMEYLLELYDEYKAIKPEDLIAEYEHEHWRDDNFIAICHGGLIEWDMKNCKLMYLMNDFSISVIYNYDGTLVISELLDTTNELITVAKASDETGEVDFKVTIEPFN